MTIGATLRPPTDPEVGGPELLRVDESEGRRLSRRRRVETGRLLYLIAVPVALLGLLPVGYIVSESIGMGWSEIVRLLARSRIRELFGNTVALLVCTVLGCAAAGVAGAWLVERTDLPGRRVFAALLVAPLAVPAFVNGYAWSSWLPGFEGLGAATVITVLSYYPFVYLPVAGTLRTLDRTLEESGAALGCSPLGVAGRVVLPQLRVALLGGSLLVGLHILAEFGALQMINYETFTTAILIQFQSTFNGAGATMLAGVLVVCCVLLVTMEVLGRGRARYARVGSGAARTHRPVRLGAARWGLVALLIAWLVLALGVPLVSIVRWWWQEPVLPPELVVALLSTLRLAAVGALVATAAGLPIAWLAVRRRGRWSTLLERAAYLTSSLPGVVVALALITVSIRYAPPLYQTTALVVISYLMLFLPRALVNLRSGLAQTGPELDDAARALGVDGVRRIVRVTLPLIAPGLAASAAFVFLAVCTELTSTLLLAPTGTTTLATSFWSLSDGLDYAAAAPYAAALVLLSAPLTFLLLQQSRRVRGR